MHTWKRPEPPRERAACEGAAAGERLISTGSGGQRPSSSGKAASDTGRGSAGNNSVLRCSSWGKFEGALDRTPQEDALKRGTEGSGGPSKRRVTLPHGLDKAKPGKGEQADRGKCGTLQAFQAEGGCRR